MLKSFQIGIAYKRNFLGRYTCKKSPRVIKGQKPSKFRKFFSKKSTFFCIFSILEVGGLFFQYLSPFPCVWTAARFLIPSKSGSRYKCSIYSRARHFCWFFRSFWDPFGNLYPHFFNPWGRRLIFLIPFTISSLLTCRTVLNSIKIGIALQMFAWTSRALIFVDFFAKIEAVRSMFNCRFAVCAV